MLEFTFFSFSANSGLAWNSFPRPRRAPRSLRKLRSIANARIPRNRKRRPDFFLLRRATSPSPADQKSIRHREQQHAIIRLIHDDGEIGELVDGDTKLRRPWETKGLRRLDWARNRIHDGCRFARKVGSQNRARLRVDRQRRGINTDACRTGRTSVRVESGDHVAAARVDVEQPWICRAGGYSGIENNARGSCTDASDGNGGAQRGTSQADVHGVQSADGR